MNILLIKRLLGFRFTRHNLGLFNLLFILLLLGGISDVTFAQTSTSEASSKPAIQLAKTVDVVDMTLEEAKAILEKNAPKKKTRKTTKKKATTKKK